MSEHKSQRDNKSRKGPNKNPMRKQQTLRTEGLGNLLRGARLKADLNMVVEPWMPLFPSQAVRRLRYSTSFPLSVTAGAVNSYVFRANDCFDPDFTSTGHQPMGFDQMILIYNHFCVLRARMICTGRNTLTTPMTVGIRQDASSTPLTVIDRIIEFGGGSFTHLEPNTVYGSVKRLELSLDVAKLQGISPPSAIIADSTLRGDAATSPSEITYFHVQAWDALAATGATWFDVILEQDVAFFEPRDLTES